MDIYLLRHGRTVSEGTYTGVTDAVLSENGVNDIVNLLASISRLPLEHCYSSTLTRCRESVDLLELECNRTFTEELREINFGRWEGLTFDQISHSDPELLHDWFKQGDSFTFPGGETIAEFNKRVTRWFDSLIRQGHGTVLVVAHAGVIRQGLCSLLGIAGHHGFCFEIFEGALSLVTHTEGAGRLVHLNCRSC
jgi:broad specificity phosphatase PhoE